MFRLLEQDTSGAKPHFKLDYSSISPLLLYWSMSTCSPIKNFVMHGPKRKQQLLISSCHDLTVRSISGCLFSQNTALIVSKDQWLVTYHQAVIVSAFRHVTFDRVHLSIFHFQSPRSAKCPLQTSELGLTWITIWEEPIYLVPLLWKGAFTNYHKKYSW